MILFFLNADNVMDKLFRERNSSRSNRSIQFTESVFRSMEAVKKREHDSEQKLTR